MEIKSYYEATLVKDTLTEVMNLGSKRHDIISIISFADFSEYKNNCNDTKKALLAKLESEGYILRLPKYPEGSRTFGIGNDRQPYKLNSVEVDLLLELATRYLIPNDS